MNDNRQTLHDPASAFRLDGRIALITGASRGIGESIARLFARQGARVILSSRKQADLEVVAEAIRNEGHDATAMACHIGDETAIAALFERIADEFGGLDILVNNAATNPHFGPVLDTPESMFDKTVDVNIRGYFRMSQLAGRMMRDRDDGRRGGCIINTSSVNGVRPGFNQGIYSITKAAIISMTEAFARECAPQKIRVNAVLPGITDTKFASALTQNEAILKMILPLIPMQRVADPDEIAPAFLFLASDEASYITGVSLPVDGGWLI